LAPVLVMVLPPVFSVRLAGMEAGVAPAAALLDRAAELAAITGAVSSAASGAGSALLVEGVAGIGKTSLLAHACDQAAAAGMAVRMARAAEFEGGYAWGVARELFEPEVRGGGGRLAGDAAALAAPALGHAGPGRRGGLVLGRARPVLADRGHRAAGTAAAGRR